MKKIVFTLLLFISTVSFGQFKINDFKPSLYYTYGNYTNNNYSSGISGYGSVRFNDFDYLIIGYDNLQIFNNDWDFDQNMIALNAVKNLYPFYVSAAYAYINGKFSYKPFTYNYRDRTHLLNAGLLYNMDLIFLGAGFTFMDLNGYKSVTAKQYYLKFHWQLSPSTLLKVIPLYSTINDGRKLYSASLGIDHKLFSNMDVMISMSIGERAYYFNPDLLTVFNQDETQKFNLSAKFSYKLGSLTVIPNFILSKFESYNIKYFSLGLQITL